MPKKIKRKKKLTQINQATPMPMDIDKVDESLEISNEDFYDLPTPIAKDIPDEDASKDIGDITQKTWADVVYPFTKQLNLYVVIPIIIYITSLVTGHLSTWKEFGFASLSILICALVLFISKKLK